MGSRSRVVRSSRSWTGTARPAAVLALAFSASTGIAAAQEAPGPDMLPDERGATMEYLVERTILKVDVLVLTVRVDRPTASKLAGLLDAESKYSRSEEETVAEIVMGADEGVATIRFLRNITLAQFLEGVDEDMGHARDAGWIEAQTFADITTSLPTWFEFLSDRGIRKGDVLTYHVSGDSLRTTYRQVGESELIFDQTDVGRQNVLALWGGYYAPGSSFREGLTRSLWRIDR